MATRPPNEELQCYLCSETSQQLSKHMKKTHKHEYDRVLNLALKLYEEDELSTREIAKRPEIFFSNSALVRALRERFTPEQMEDMRKKKIGRHTKQKFENGEFDEMLEKLVARNKSNEGKRKNSLGVQKAYDSGKLVPWAKGKTKYTCEKLLKKADALSVTMKQKYLNGELTTLLPSGPANPVYKDGKGAELTHRTGKEFDRAAKAAIRIKYDYKCGLCQRTNEQMKKERETMGWPRWFLESDHIIPLSQGGTNDIDNGQLVCTECHIFKTQMQDLKKSVASIKYRNYNTQYLAKLFDGEIFNGYARINDRNFKIVSNHEEITQESVRQLSSDSVVWFHSDEWIMCEDV